MIDEAAVRTQISGTELVVRVDADLMQQALVNLIRNALQAMTEKGCGSGVGRLTLSARPELDFVVLSVADTGTGIDQTAVDRIFNPFFTTRNTGTGLGLAISMQFVQGMGGQMGVESQLGQGATFWLELPLPLTGAPLPLEADITAAEVEVDLQGVRVLVVDDEAVNRSIASEYLQRAGCVVQVAHDGQQALEMFQAGQQDLVLMDLQMPRMDGFQSSQQMRQLERGSNPAGEPVVIIALSASVVGEVGEQCRQAGMDDYVSKPFRWAEFQAAIGRHLPGRVSLPQAPVLPAENSDSTTEEAIALFQPDQLMELGGLELVQEISALAGTTIGRDMEELAEAIQAEDWSEVRRRGHRMKGAAANSGAQRMSAMAARMEGQAEGQAPGQVKELYPQLLEIWQQTQTAMEDWLSEISV